MKIYEVIIQYLEPTQAVVRIIAKSEEDAVNKIRDSMTEMADLQFIEVKESEQTMEAFQEESAMEAFAHRTLN